MKKTTTNKLILTTHVDSWLTSSFITVLSSIIYTGKIIFRFTELSCDIAFTKSMYYPLKMLIVEMSEI